MSGFLDGGRDFLVGWRECRMPSYLFAGIIFLGDLWDHRKTQDNGSMPVRWALEGRHLGTHSSSRSTRGPGLQIN